MTTSATRPPPATQGGGDHTTRPADLSASWFGSEGEALQGPGPGPAHGPAQEPPKGPWWQGVGSKGRPAPTARSRTVHGKGSTYTRLYRTFLAARAALGLILMVAAFTSTLLDRTPSRPTLVATLAYAALAIAWWWWPSQRQLGGERDVGLSKRQAVATIGVDIGSFAVLTFLERGFNVNAAALMALPVLMAAVMMPRFMALGTAATATLILLAGAVVDTLLRRDLTTSLTPTGLTGFGLFAVALIVSELSSRLAREQRSARGHMELARQQAQLNRLVIEEMPEGVLAVDRQGHVRTANPSARRLLSAHGMTSAAPFQLRGVPAWEPLVQAIEQAFAAPRRFDDAREIALTFDDRTRRTLRMRLKFTRGQGLPNQDDVCVLFLEDLRTVQARVRQDKLAAMGRMSAGIAHEIRNPLAAIAQANALLAEDAQDSDQRRLTSLVADNVDRLKRIVDDILAVAPGARPTAPAVDLERMLKAVCDEWVKLHPAAADRRLLKLATDGLPPRELGPVATVTFEPEHFRRVLVNLLDNGLRHGTGQAESIVVNAQLLLLQEQPPQVQVSVMSDGAVIEPETERSLFEPFFSTRSRGTGLGLYICRELCERHGASIDYRPHPPTQRHRNEFLIVMPLAQPASLLP